MALNPLFSASALIYLMDNITNNDLSVNPPDPKITHTHTSHSQDSQIRHFGRNGFVCQESATLPPLANRGVINFLTTGTPAIDYLSLTSFSSADFQRIQQFASTVDAESTPKKVRQYDGFIRSNDDGSVFVGRAIQNGRPHVLTQISGSLAHSAFSTLMGIQRCTRIDLQVTLPQHDGYSARLVKDSLSAAAWPRRGNTPQIKMIEGLQGDDTLYIGSRPGGRLVRIYQKLDAHQNKYLRFEPELRGDFAHDVYAKLCGGEVTISDCLYGEFLRLPALHSPYFDLLDGLLSGDTPFTPKRVQSPDKSEMRWFKRQVKPALERMLRDHSMGHELASYLKYLVDLYTYEIA